MDSVPLLVTSAVIASSSLTEVFDPLVRLRLTLQGLSHWLTTPGISSIVVCDGSGYDLRPHIERIARSNTRIEVLSFTNDISAVRAKGKGYGEGEIVNYAIRHSLELRNSGSFAKCTAKLWVGNYGRCVTRYNGHAAFDFIGRMEKIDTRFYIASKEFFTRYLSDAHRQVDDTAGYYLEHAYMDAFKKALRPAEYLMIPTPRISGVSGSTGQTYRPSVIKAHLRDGRSFLMKFIS